MFCVFKDHIDGFIFEDHLLQGYDILMRYLAIELLRELVLPLFEGRKKFNVLRFLELHSG